MEGVGKFMEREGLGEIDCRLGGYKAQYEKEEAQRKTYTMTPRAYRLCGNRKVKKRLLSGECSYGDYSILQS